MISAERIKEDGLWWKLPTAVGLTALAAGCSGSVAATAGNTSPAKATSRAEGSASATASAGSTPFETAVSDERYWAKTCLGLTKPDANGVIKGVVIRGPSSNFTYVAFLDGGIHADCAVRNDTGEVYAVKAGGLTGRLAMSPYQSLTSPSSITASLVPYGTGRDVYPNTAANSAAAAEAAQAEENLDSMISGATYPNS